MAPDVDTRTVALQDRDPASVLATYRRLLWLRRRHPALQTGRYRRLSFPARDLFAFERKGEAESIVVAVNFGQRPVTFRVGTLRRWSTIFDTHDSIAAEVSGDDKLMLAARQAVILLAG
jgi:glycosidase